jgi:hypothetical protein
MKLKITKNGTIHRGVPKAAGEIVTEDDKNHAGGLMCAGAVPVKGDERPAPEPAPTPSPEPEEKSDQKSEPPKKKAAKKKAAQKKADD